MSDHFIYAYVKTQSISDLILLTGIAIFLRPVQREQSSLRGGSEFARGNDPTSMVADSASYTLLPADANDQPLLENDELEATSFEMTTQTPTESSSINPVT